MKYTYQLYKMFKNSRFFQFVLIFSYLCLQMTSKCNLLDNKYFKFCTRVANFVSSFSSTCLRLLLSARPFRLQIQLLMNKSTPLPYYSSGGIRTGLCGKNRSWCGRKCDKWPATDARHLHTESPSSATN